MLTNFAQLTNEQKTIWSMDLWKQARNMSFINQFLGEGPNSMIQHITELKKTEKGTRAVITLLADLAGDGVAGDQELEGREEAMKTDEQVIRYDQLRHANRNKGRIADQKTIVNFRTNSRDRLAYWLSDRMDQLALLTLSGRSYTLNTDGTTRVGSSLPELEFAADVTAPTSLRQVRWNGTSKLIEVGGATSAVTATDLPMWELFVQLKAMAKTRYVRGIREAGGEETYHAFLTPTAMAKLKLDPTYMQNLRHTANVKETSKLFSGDAIKIDGIWLHEHRHVYDTTGAASGSKWGSGGLIEGCQILFCGAQALGMADIGNPYWNEEEYDYGNSQGIAIGKMLGFKKPVFKNMYEANSAQDFGVISAYVAI